MTELVLDRPNGHMPGLNWHLDSFDSAYLLAAAPAVRRLPYPQPVRLRQTLKIVVSSGIRPKFGLVRFEREAFTTGLLALADVSSIGEERLLHRTTRMETWAYFTRSEKFFS